MALDLTDRMNRMLTFLINARHPELLRQLSTRGFDQAAIDEGWELFLRAARARLQYDPANGQAASQAAELLALDAWENTWFPLIDATLTRHFPDLRAAVLQNIAQTSGREVIVSVGTVLDRLDALSGSPEGDQALALLAARGLTAETRNEARTMIDKLQHVADPLPEPTTDSREDTVEQAWAWYREWAQIARTVVTRNDYLIRLGLRQPTSASRARNNDPAVDPTEASSDPMLAIPEQTAARDVAEQPPTN